MTLEIAFIFYFVFNVYLMLFCYSDGIETRKDIILMIALGLFGTFLFIAAIIYIVIKGVKDFPSTIAEAWKNKT